MAQLLLVLLVAAFVLGYAFLVWRAWYSVPVLVRASVSGCQSLRSTHHLTDQQLAALAELGYDWA
ncbi:hypothetical protein [Streptomyces sp. NBC_00624]|uniref:hypothetical protein n=1 Tax=Streptomyces sp. NBC_00624 TaxID=2975791 RepID=UPI0030E03614